MVRQGMKRIGNKKRFFFSQEPIKTATGAVLTEKKMQPYLTISVCASG